MTIETRPDLSTTGHVIACASCGAELGSRPGWRLDHQVDGSHLAVFWGHPSATPGYASTRVPLPEVEGGPGVVG